MKQGHKQHSKGKPNTSYAGSSTGDKGKKSTTGNPRTKLPGDTHK